MNRALALAIAICLAPLTASPRLARADAGPKFPERAFVISPGMLLGGTSSLDVGTGFTLGGEISALYWRKMAYVGGVIDGLYDWKREHGRSMIGAMIGAGPFGVDGGYLVEYGESTHHGGAVRLFVSLGVMALYCRYGGLIDAPDFLEWGLLIKVPIQAWSVYRSRPRPHPPSVRPSPPRPTRPTAQGIEASESGWRR